VDTGRKHCDDHAPGSNFALNRHSVLIAAPANRTLTPLRRRALHSPYPHDGKHIFSDTDAHSWPSNVRPVRWNHSSPPQDAGRSREGTPGILFLLPASIPVNVIPDADTMQRKTRSTVAELLQKAGHHVRVVQENELTPPRCGGVVQETLGI
jgi:hypothetical protein